MIKLVRVDHRLLHGQVAFTWTSALGADCILIANDAVPKDDLRKTSLKLAKPAGVKLVIKSIEDSIAAINSGVTDKYKLMIITESIKDVKRLADGCPSITSINLGGTKAKENTKNISKAMNVTEEDVQMLQELINRGLEVEIRMTSNENKILAKTVI
ncbi:MAG: PTS sugar transporter subunit IIB [Bacillota bacterium]|nr:PTS sugar transporter subunit IIB [Bacillota bacterium]